MFTAECMMKRYCFNVPEEVKGVLSSQYVHTANAISAAIYGFVPENIKYKFAFEDYFLLYLAK